MIKKNQILWKKNPQNSILILELYPGLHYENPIKLNLSSLLEFSDLHFVMEMYWHVL